MLKVEHINNLRTLSTYIINVETVNRNEKLLARNKIIL